MFKGEPCGHYVVIDPNTVEEKTKGGIIRVVEGSLDKKLEENAITEGTVVAVGNMAWKAIDGDMEGWKPWAKVGDRVQYKKHVADFILDKDDPKKRYFLVTDENILVNFSGA